MRFFRTPSLLRALYPGLKWRVRTDEKVVYLTFDDGPSPGVTEFVLDALNEFDAHATFFCIGNNIAKHPSIFDKVVGQRHKVGNHTYKHLKGWSTSVSSYKQDVDECQTLMKQSKLFRPPYGRIKRSQIRSLESYDIVMWDVLTYDYAKLSSQEQTLSGVIRATRPGSIVVFHDSLKAEVNVRFMLPRFLKHFSELGYRFESLPDEFK
ncbi:MAG: polysaccharide deacetylase family protein [Cyclobacteriaceae bacterium]